MAVLFGLWLAIFFCALFSPPLLDDADATHAQAAQAMLRTGDWTTLHVDGVRYLEKAPLPYWIAAASLRVFGATAFAVHLPLALAVLALALVGYCWSSRCFGRRAAFQSALFLLTSVGPFLFTRVFIPEALLSLLLACGLYCLVRALEDKAETWWAYGFWTCMALAVLTKGLIAIVFLLGTAFAVLALTRSWPHWKRLRPASGCLLFLAIAAPWHIAAAVRNQGSSSGHGFLWFYFVNEHVLRFLGRREPRDYNRVPPLLYWPLHVIWLAPWSFLTPAAAVVFARGRLRLLRTPTEAGRTLLTLACFSLLVLLFFAFSTNQEYYTFPAYLPLLMLLAAAQRHQGASDAPGLLDACFGALAVVSAALAALLGCGLWLARGLPSTDDLSSLLGRRGIGGYTLSMSHFFDLTGASFAALRLPASLACVALLVGPLLAFGLQRRRKPDGAILAVALSSAILLVAAHIALVRFTPVLSSQQFAVAIQALQRSGQVEPDTEILLLGDQAHGSSVPFYLGRPVPLVEGRSSSMLFGSTFPDSAAVFVSAPELLAQWGHGTRKLLFVPEEERELAQTLLADGGIVVLARAGKQLLTDRPLLPGSTNTR